MNEIPNSARSEEIVVDEFFPHAPEIVWWTITTPELVGRWLRMEPSGFIAEVGNRFTYQTTPAGAWDGKIRCEVLEVEPNARLVYAWRGGVAANSGYGSLLDTRVVMTLTPVEGGTRLRVVHSGFVLPRNETAYRNMSGGWSEVVRRIGSVADDREG